MDKESSHQLEQEQRERLTEIGAYLRQLREQQQLSLEDIHKRTWIRTSLLKAIEEGQIQRLPEPVYIRGFIKRYAEAIEQDGEAFSEAFPIQTIRPKQSFWRLSPAIPLRPLHLYFAYVLLIMAAVSGLSYAMNRSDPFKNRPESTFSTAQAPVAEEQSVTASASPSAVAANPVSNKPIRINVTLISQSWLRVVVDGRTDFEGILSEGTQRTWVGDSEVVLRAGNAGGVMVAYNEGQSKPMGNLGSVEEVTFSANRNAVGTSGAMTAALAE